MARRGIDMLPLLDVFMVVLFVFATIQEQQLDSSAHERDTLSKALSQVTRERDQRAERVEQLLAELAELAARSEQQAAREQQLEQLELLVEAYEQECGPRKAHGPVCPPAAVNPDAKAQAAMAALHERLLDNVAVFEVEIEGQPDRVTGKIHNRCCWRADPPDGQWRSCGEIPSDATEQLAWLDDGAAGLIDGLSRTRGGNAVVLLRQGEQARYRISNDLAELLRERMASHRVYDDGTSAGPPQCSLLR